MKWAHRKNTLRLTCALRFLTTLVFALQATRSISGQTFWNPGDGQDFLSASADVAVSGGQPTRGGQLTLNCTIVFPQFAALYVPYQVAWYRKRQNETQWTRIANDTKVDIGYPSNKYAVTVRYPQNWERSIYYDLVINGLASGDSAAYKCVGVDNPTDSQWCLNVEAVTPQVLVTCNGTQVSSLSRGVYQQVTGVFLNDGRKEGFKNYTLVLVNSADDCQLQCECLLSTCNVFSFSSTLRQCHIIDVDFYNSWTTADASNPTWTSFYRTARAPGGRKLLFKMSQGIGLGTTYTLTAEGNYNATASLSEMALDDTCSCYIKSSIIDLWSRFPITKVDMVLATAGSPTKSLSFNAQDATISTFFDHNRILSTSWTDLMSTAPISVMQMSTTATWQGKSIGRDFVIAKTPYNGCPNDVGWISVSGRGEFQPCSYDHIPIPAFAYSDSVTAGSMNSAKFADALLVYAYL